MGGRSAEHHVELREAEHEALGTVDQRDLDLISQRLRQAGAQLEPAEPGTQHHDLHRSSSSWVVTSLRDVLHARRQAADSTSALIASSVACIPRWLVLPRAHPSANQYARSPSVGASVNDSVTSVPSPFGDSS